ncbi:MAG: recombinase family protein, partial [Myxococcales bacterium]|nr:recombinase family protein [Myxococcales bacterium]
RMGQSYRAIAAKLNADRVRTKRGGRWHHNTVAKVVARREYYREALGEI